MEAYRALRTLCHCKTISIGVAGADAPGLLVDNNSGRLGCHRIGMGDLRQEMTEDTRQILHS